MNGCELSKMLIFFFIFVSVSILLSFWIGYFWRNSYFIFVLSSLIAFYINRKYPVEFKIPRNIRLLSIVMLVMTAYPVLFVTPFYSGSADALHTTHVRIIKDKIPDTYAPYSNLKLIYQIGFHLFVKMFTDFFPFIPDYLILWFFGVVFSTAMVALTYQFATTFFKSETYGEWAAILLIGTKTPFQFMFWGVYPNILAIDLFLLCFTLFLQNNRLIYLLFPVTFMVHPVGALMLIFFIGVYCFYYKDFKRLLSLAPSISLALPSLWMTYVPLLESPATPPVFEPIAIPLIQRLVDMIFPMPAWFGIVPFIFAVLSLNFVLRNRYFEREVRFILSTVLLSFLLYAFFYFQGYLVPSKLFVLVTFASLLLAAVLPSRSKLGHSGILKIAVIVLCILTFLSSGELTKLRGGSKINKDDVEFAHAFKEFSPELAETLFLAPRGGWMAHISNKIPYDVKTAVFVQYGEPQVIRDQGWEEMNLKRKQWEEIYYNKCVECIYELNVTYVVINKKYFDRSLNEKPIFQHGQFDVYMLR